MDKFVIVSLLFFSCLVDAQPSSAIDADHEHQQWLKEQFSAKHQALIPVVAVADMFYGCNQERKSEPVNYQIKDLVTRVDRDKLAQMLSTCLAEDSPKSDVALNFGLKSCFREQFSHLPKAERTEKMALVTKSIEQLPRVERQKSFTLCVTEQAIQYLR